MNVLLLELIDDNGHNYIIGIFSSIPQVKAFMIRNGTPIDEDSKIEDNGIIFYSTTANEIAITKLTINKSIGEIKRNTKINTT